MNLNFLNKNKKLQLINKIFKKKAANITVIS